MTLYVHLHTHSPSFFEVCLPVLLVQELCEGTE
jgi:hypothetical protein